MASISRDPNGRKTIQFVACDGKRKSVRLGKASQHIAEQVRVKVEALHAAAVAGLPWDAETARRVNGLAPALYDKLAAVGLVPKRQEANRARLGEFLADYIAGRTDVKGGTATNLKIGANRLTAFFGDNRDLRSITPGDCDQWAIWLKERYAGATVGKSVKWARQFFRAAVRKKLIAENPFEEVKAPAMSNKAREFFVSREVTARVLQACPNAEWRLIFALSRYGGLRCPSEHLALTWPDVDWERGRFRVTSPKTEHHEGKEERWVPIFPELRPHLEEAFEQAADGELHVITRYRRLNKNLRTQLGRIIRRAGLTPWPRLFHNLRSSRETELAAEYPLHIVCAWIGNTERIAQKHYLQVTDADFERAAKSGAEGAREALQKPVQQPAAPARTEMQTALNSLESCEMLPEGATRRNSLPDRRMTPTGFEPVSQP
jgi:integrase